MVQVVTTAISLLLLTLTMNVMMMMMCGVQLHYIYFQNRAEAASVTLSHPWTVGINHKCLLFAVMCNYT